MTWLSIDYDNPELSNIQDVLESLRDGAQERAGVVSADDTPLTHNKLNVLLSADDIMQDGRDVVEDSFSGVTINTVGWLKSLSDLDGLTETQAKNLSYYDTGSSFNGLATDAGWASFNEYNTWYSSASSKDELYDHQWIQDWVSRFYDMVNRMKYGYFKHIVSIFNDVTSKETSGSDVRYIYDLSGLGLQASFVLYKYDTVSTFTLSELETFTERATATSAWYPSGDLATDQVRWRLDLTGTNGFTYKDW